MQDNFKILLSKNILLVDDNPVIIKILSKGLQDKCSNFNIVTFTDVREAVNFLNKNDKFYFDLVLTDIHMPDMSGIELTKYIREDLNISKDELPILVYSSMEDSNSMKEAKLAGCNEYYTKPKNSETIARNISKWLLNDYFPDKNIDHEKIIINRNTLNGINIIIADDEILSLAIIAKKFTKFGANIFKCTDGSEVVDLIKKDPVKYHLIITDIYMKEIDGVEEVKLVRNIQDKYNKKYNSNYRIPIIAISTDDNQDFIRKALNVGIDDYIVKGCDGNSMIKLSKFWIDYAVNNSKNIKLKLVKSSQ